MDLTQATDTVIDPEEAQMSAGHENEGVENEGVGESAPEAQAEAEAPVEEQVDDSKLGPGQELSDEELEREVTTLLFASPEVMTMVRLVKLLDRPASARVKAALETVAARLEASELPIVLRPISGGWRLLTDPAMGDVVARLRKEPKPERISGAALETLAIVAYRQPASKAEIEAIRGVQSGQMLRSLVDRGLIKVTGRAETPGAPLQYGTTKDFLDRFGLANLKALPRDGELVQGN